MKKKTVLIVLGSAVAVIAAIIGVVFYATSGMTGAADRFFEIARGGEQAEMYALTSAELRNSTSAEQLAGFIKANRFDQVAETSWSSRSIENGLGSLEGALTLDDGGVVPLSLQLVEEGGDWKISFIKLREAGLSGGVEPQMRGGAADVPPENVVLNTVWFHTGLVFDVAQQEAGLGLQSSLEYFQQFCVEDITIAQLEELVAPLRNEKAGVELLDKARPVVERVSPLENGGFRAEGYFEAVPWRYAYTYSFARDGERWRLAAVEYDLREYE